MKANRSDDSANLASQFVRALRSALTNVASSHLASSLEEGDVYICSTCDLAVKICAGNPNAVCILKVRKNTELDLLLHEYASFLAGSRRVCAECGRELSRHQPTKNPLLELCSTCQQRPKKARRMNTQGIES